MIYICIECREYHRCSHIPGTRICQRQNCRSSDLPLVRRKNSHVIIPVSGSRNLAADIYSFESRGHSVPHTHHNQVKDKRFWNASIF